MRNRVFLREFRTSLLKAVKYPRVSSVEQHFEKDVGKSQEEP